MSSKPVESIPNFVPDESSFIDVRPTYPLIHNDTHEMNTMRSRPDSAHSNRAKSRLCYGICCFVLGGIFVGLMLILAHVHLFSSDTDSSPQLNLISVSSLIKSLDHKFLRVQSTALESKVAAVTSLVEQVVDVLDVDVTVDLDDSSVDVFVVSVDGMTHPVKLSNINFVVDPVYQLQAVENLIVNVSNGYLNETRSRISSDVAYPTKVLVNLIQSNNLWSHEFGSVEFFYKNHEHISFEEIYHGYCVSYNWFCIEFRLMQHVKVIEVIFRSDMYEDF
ncbi:hypothetical protein GEMRC1_006833 [Eukaryota sp. GEM-RC1]